MATYTTPATRATGFLVDAATWNAEHVENIKHFKETRTDLFTSTGNTVPADYPTGLALSQWAAATAGAPNTTDSFVVVTQKYSNFSLMQWAMVRDATPEADEEVYLRFGYSGGTPEWSAWRRLTTSNEQVISVASVDLPSIPANSRIDQDIAVTGVRTVDAAWYISGVATTGLGVMQTSIPTNGTIRIRVANYTAAAVDAAATSFQFGIIRGV